MSGVFCKMTFKGATKIDEKNQYLFIKIDSINSIYDPSVHNK